MQAAVPAAEAGHDKPTVERARELVLEHGWNSTSFQIVNPGIKRWFAERGDAVVGYAVASGFRVVAGAPVCEKDRLQDVAAEFEADAKRCSQRVCYFAAEERLEAVFRASPTHSKFLIGAQPAWHPAEWEAIVARHKSFRAQLNRARNKGVKVSEWATEKARNNPRLRACLESWLETKGLPPLHFMVESDTLSRLDHRRVFAAEIGERVVGFVVLSPVAKRNGWLFEQFPHVRQAPNGTVETMIDAAMRRLAADGCEYATLGLSPLSRRAAVEPFENPFWLRAALGWLRKHGQRFYNFDGLDSFKAKLRPSRWEPVFALENEPEVTPAALYAIAGAFSGGTPFKLVFGGLFRAVRSELRWLANYLRAA